MGMPGVDPKQAAEVQKTSSKVNAEVKILYKENEIRLKLTPTTTESKAFVDKFLPNFANTMSQQLAMFFGIKGEIVDVGKPKN